MTERTPLLQNTLTSEDLLGETNPTYENLTYKGELLRLARNTVPISLSFAFQNAIQAYSIFLVGGIVEPIYQWPLGSIVGRDHSSFSQQVSGTLNSV